MQDDGKRRDNAKGLLFPEIAGLIVASQLSKLQYAGQISKLKVI